MTSFDLGEFGAPFVAKRWIDMAFPGRHTLVLGSSMQTLLDLLDGNSHLDDGDAAFTCDIIFIDGGHEYEVVAADVLNFWRLASPGAPVVFDDVHHGWFLAPCRVLECTGHCFYYHFTIPCFFMTGANCCSGVVRAWEEAISSGVLDPQTATCDEEKFCTGNFLGFNGDLGTDVVRVP
jgi:hypothetical protein